MYVCICIFVCMHIHIYVLLDACFKYAAVKSEKTKSASKPTTAKILRESRNIPTLVFRVEQFEVLLLKLSKAVKVTASSAYD